MKILDFDLEGNHFIIEADISLRQKADDNMKSHWPHYFFENTQVYVATVLSQFQAQLVFRNAFFQPQLRDPIADKFFVHKFTSLIVSISERFPGY